MALHVGCAAASVASVASDASEADVGVHGADMGGACPPGS